MRSLTLEVDGGWEKWSFEFSQSMILKTKDEFSLFLSRDKYSEISVQISMIYGGIKMKEKLQNLLFLILFVYGMIGFAMTFYFEWQYAVEEGFWKWLFIGSWVGMFKGMFWPFFI